MWEAVVWFIAILSVVSVALQLISRQADREHERRTDSAVESSKHLSDSVSDLYKQLRKMNEDISRLVSENATLREKVSELSLRVSSVQRKMCTDC